MNWGDKIVVTIAALPMHRCMVGVAAAIALTLSQAQAMDLQTMDQEGLFNAIVTVTLYQKKCGGDVSPHLKSVLDSMAKSYGIDMFDPEDINKALERTAALYRFLEETPERLADFCVSTKQQVDELETDVKRRQ